MSEEQADIRSRVSVRLGEAFHGAVIEHNEPTGAITERSQAWQVGDDYDPEEAARRISAYWVRQIKTSIVFAMRGAMPKRAIRDPRHDVELAVIASCSGYLNALKRGRAEKPSDELTPAKILGCSAIVDDELTRLADGDEVWVVGRPVFLHLDTVTVAKEEGIVESHARYSIAPSGAEWVGPGSHSPADDDLAYPGYWKQQGEQGFLVQRMRLSADPSVPIEAIN